jgi:hypothetical protein
LRIFGVGGLIRNCGRACRNSTKSLSRFQASSQGCGQNGASEIIREGTALGRTRSTFNLLPTQRLDTFKSTSYSHSFAIRLRLSNIKLLTVVLQVLYASDTRLNLRPLLHCPSITNGGSHGDQRQRASAGIHASSDSHVNYARWTEGAEEGSTPVLREFPEIGRF